MNAIRKPLYDGACLMEEATIPDSFEVTAAGVFFTAPGMPMKQITRVPVWVAQTVQQLNTLEMLTTLGVKNADGSVEYITVPSDTFHSFQRMRKRVLRHVDLQLENWVLDAVLRYIRLSELTCWTAVVTEECEFFADC